jgi:hypothetical protein
MDDRQALIFLQGDLAKIVLEARDGQGFTAAAWSIEPWPIQSLTFYVTMAGRDGERYMLRLIAQDYADCPPSIACVCPKTKQQNVPRVWPQCEGFRPPTDLCLNISREGLMSLHPAWQTDPRYRWEKSGNPIEVVLWGLHDRLMSEKYVGRFNG